MTRNTLPVVAAVPNYNMADSLQTLLPDLLERGYADVFVLDDNSQDHSADVGHNYARDVTFVHGSENVGAGANRNRIIPALGYRALIHFIDADMVPDAGDSIQAAQDIMSGPNLGFVGGLVKDTEGTQIAYNYGPRQGLRGDISAQVQLGVDTLRRSNPERAVRLRNRFSRLLQDWPNQFQTPTAREVFWSTENMVIDSEVFAGVGGFDPKLREHEIADLSIRLDKLGLTRRFDPAIAGTHMGVQVRHYNRLTAMAKAEFYIAHKHGFLNWLSLK